MFISSLLLVDPTVFLSDRLFKTTVQLEQISSVGFIFNDWVRELIKLSHVDFLAYVHSK